jgi:hypothetical protein
MADETSKRVFTVQAQESVKFANGAKGGNVYICSGNGSSGSPIEGEPAILPGEDGDIVFQTGLQEALRLTGTGEVFVRGQKVATDREVYEGLREWLGTALYRHDKGEFKIQGR